AFAAAAVLSVYAKQPAALLFPAFAAHAATRLGVRRLVRRDVLVAVTSIVLLSAPIVPITLMLSHANVQMVAYNLGRGSLRLWPIVTEALSAQLSRVVLLLAAAGLV